ncbi:zinc finger CCCH domain-containing protein 3-like [Platysternon megacephalum]|uniref:Zinc finger CCCH domain-containing protein 3-like n=1 Tax=Platysternon megacephalum TaxID=55544 RepID=A0A4D9E2Y3_9SAUR|nr:zinc finger CCCH domain-containing protein 3-like [Platysternon megacephalum]
MCRGGGAEPAQPWLSGDAQQGSDDLRLRFAMDGMTCFMVALVTLVFWCPGQPGCIARRPALRTGVPVLLPLLLSVPAFLGSPMAGIIIEVGLEERVVTLWIYSKGVLCRMGSLPGGAGMIVKEPDE